MQQQTSEWHQWRTQGIGASEAPIIMGVSPYKTRYELWEEKTKRIRKPYQGNFATERGNRLEPIARANYELEQNCEATAILCENEIYPFIRASLDGYDAERGIVLEIKCPGRGDHQLALDGIVPTKYYPQVQHQLLACSSAKLAHYYSFDGEKGVLLVVERDKEYQEKLLKELIKFWDCVKNDTAPESEERDFVQVESPHIGSLLDTYDSQCKQIKELEKSNEQIRERIFEEIGDNRALINRRWKVAQVYRGGSIDYSAIPELHGLNLERYRKGGSVYKTITEIKK